MSFFLINIFRVVVPTFHLVVGDLSRNGDLHSPFSTSQYRDLVVIDSPFAKCFPSQEVYDIMSP